MEENRDRFHGAVDYELTGVRRICIIENSAVIANSSVFQGERIFAGLTIDTVVVMKKDEVLVILKD